MLSRNPWRADLVVKLWIAFLTSLFIGALILEVHRGLARKEGVEPNELVAALVTFLTFHVVGLVLIDSFVRAHGVTWREAFGFNSPRGGRDALLGALAAMIALPVCFALAWVSDRFFTRLGVPLEAQRVVQTLQASDAVWKMAYQGVLAILFAPVLEEIVFRGILYRTIKQHGFPRLALWGTSILFGAVHANLGTLLPLCFLGALLALVYDTSRNLLSSIVTHSLFNAVNFIMLLRG